MDGPAADRVTVNIACATDDAYAPHCATMLRSLFAHNDAASLRIHVLHDAGLSGDARQRLEQMVTGAGSTLRWLELAPAQLEGFPDDRFHITCWYRVLLPDLLPRETRMLYLDSDMLVRGPLLSLWQQDLAGKLFGAVINPLYPFMPDHPAALGLGGIREYPNSGVMLMDLAAMRAAGLVEKLRAYAAAHRRNPYPEQDALAVVCRGQWLALDPRWNAQSTVFDVAPERLPFAREAVLAARSDPAIVHFIGPLKPWHYLCRHPLRHEYAAHRRRTPWPAFELEGRTWRNRILRPLSLGAQVRLRLLAARWIPEAWLQRRLRGPRLMRAFARLYPEASFVQIGSNDGVKQDPLRRELARSRWRGVMVEPVPYVFARLERRYGGRPDLSLEPVAIAAQSGTLPFYHLPEAHSGEALPYWYDGLGSFRREVVLKHAYAIPDIEQRLVTTEVPCITFDELCRRNRIETLDLLHTDTEGYDAELLASIDFTRFRPLLLVYEHKHLGAAAGRCRQRLRSLGYRTFEEGADTWCVDERERDERHRQLLEAYQQLVAAPR